MSEKVTIYDIANRAGVSTTTVYKAMHNLKGVSQAKREAILAIISEMNYERNSIAQTLARKEIKIGVVFEALNQEFTYPILDGIKTTYEQLKSYKVNMIFSNTDENVNKERVLHEFSSMLEMGVDGIILFPSVPYPEYEKFNNQIKAKGIPVVTVINEIPYLETLTCVQYDGTLLGRIAGDLMNLCNPGGNCAVIIGNKDVVAQQLTIEGFREALKNSGGTVVAAYENQFMERLNRPLIDNILKTYPYIEGVFVGVSQSVEVVNRLKELGLDKQCKIITVDTFPFIEKSLLDGSITATLNRHPFYMGQVAVNTVYNYLTNATAIEKRIFLPSSIVLPSNVGYSYQPSLAESLIPYRI